MIILLKSMTPCFTRSIFTSCGVTKDKSLFLITFMQVGLALQIVENFHFNFFSPVYEFTLMESILSIKESNSLATGVSTSVSIKINLENSVISLSELNSKRF